MGKNIVRPTAVKITIAIIRCAFFILAIIALGIIALWQITLWLKWAEWVDVDMLTIYAAALGPTPTFPNGCWPLSNPPIVTAQCHAVASAHLRLWAVSAKIGAGTALVAEWFSDLWLGWYVLGLIVVSFPRDMD